MRPLIQGLYGIQVWGSGVGKYVRACVHLSASYTVLDMQHTTLFFSPIISVKNYSLVGKWTVHTRFGVF